MVSLTHPKSPISLHIFSTMTKPSSSSSSSTTSSSSSSLTTNMKLKTLIHNLIFSHICRVIRALSKAKSLFLDIFRENNLLVSLKQAQKKKNKYRNKLLFGSFRLHYNWCSSNSHVLPIPTSPTNHHIYYDSTWNLLFSTNDGDHHANNHGVNIDCEKNNKEGEEKEDTQELSSYLQWLEEKGEKNDSNNVENEIDRLADMFIASCHEKFRLEKIESYRRYQEMLARSM